MRRHHRRPLFLRPIDIGRNQQSVKMHKLRHIGLVDDVDGDRNPFLHPQQRPRRSPVIPDRTKDAIRRQFDRDRPNLEREIGLSDVP